VAPPVNVMQPIHRFTANSLGVNTTNPQSNLDVNGTGRFVDDLEADSHLNQAAPNSDLGGTFLGDVSRASGNWTEFAANVHAAGSITFNYRCTGNPN
jgi:hypothetical protein